MNLITGLFNILFNIIRGIFNILFNIINFFLGNHRNNQTRNNYSSSYSNDYSRNSIEDERISKLDESKKRLFSNMYDNAISQLKLDYTNNKTTSFVGLNTQFLSISNLDRGIQRQIATNATYKAASDLGIKINVSCVEFDSYGIMVRTDW